ncbi:protein of unknown function [Pararobbsia alpina]
MAKVSTDMNAAVISLKNASYAGNGFLRSATRAHATIHATEEIVAKEIVMPTHPAKAALHIEPVNVYGNNGLRVTVETGSLILDVSTIDALIEELARLRSDMQPCVNREVDRKKPFLVEVDPDWHAQSNPLIDGSVLLMRHPGFGWTCFALPRESIKRLVNVLNEQLEQTEPVEGLAN